MDIFSNHVFPFLEALVSIVSLVFNPTALYSGDIKPVTVCFNLNGVAQVMPFKLKHIAKQIKEFIINILINLFFLTGWTRWVSWASRIERAWNWCLEYVVGLISEPYTFTWSLSITPDFNSAWWAYGGPSISLYWGYQGVLLEMVSIPILSPHQTKIFPYATIQLLPAIISMPYNTDKDLWELCLSIPISWAGMRRLYKICRIDRFYRKHVRPTIYFIDV